jgi:hypothetical protein
MKKTNIKYYLGAFLMLFTASACEDKLDINDNPNAATKADVQLVLPQAIVASASISNQYNTYGAHFGGYMANAGGFSGFGNLLNYNLTPTDWNGLWVNTYQDPLADLKYVMDETEGIDELAYFNAAAKIMTVVNYQRLVDAFGNIPYSEALKADEGIVAPKYDDAATIYLDLFAKLDEAITTIDNAEFPLSLNEANDPLFGDEDIDSWRRYANTLKLRILIRLSGKTEFDAFVSEGFANLNLGIGFLEDDAIVDPGYEVNRPNPAWNAWGRTAALALSNSSRVPTKFAFGFYNGKISDAARGEVTYVNYPTTPVNQLGVEDGAPTIVTGAVTWASNETSFGANDADLTGLGILKGAGMGQPLMLKAEAQFLIAEAQLNDRIGSVNGMDVTGNYYEGIKASFAYLFKDEDENIKDTVGLVANYIDANAGNHLVEFEAAASKAEQLEAIITQKYIAVNMINSDEGWNEYRRTGYPISKPGDANAQLDIASTKSDVSSRNDRLPTRILYPSSELSYNATNYRTVDYTSELIFWDPN